MWVKVFAVYSEFDPDKLIRSLTLRRGLNIIWAKDSESGASGHAAGKTTFCRMLRYILGDTTFGSDEFKTAFRLRFPNGCMASEIRLEGVPWLVVRPLGVSGHHWCAPETQFDQLFSEDTRHRDFSEFITALRKSMIEPLAAATFPGTDRAVEWVHLLQWLTRDQDARYSHILNWRETSESGKLLNTEKTNLIRMVLGLLTKDELDSQAIHSEFLTEQSQIDTEIPKLTFARDRTVNTLAKQISALSDRSTDLAMTVMAEKAKADTAIKELENQLAEAKAHDGVGDVLTAQLRALEAQKDEHVGRRDAVKRELALMRNRLSFEKEELSEEQFKAASAKLGDIEGKCSQPIALAHAFNCPLKPRLERDQLQEERIRVAHSNTEVVEEQIALYEQNLAVLEKQCTEALRSHSQLDDKVEELRLAHTERRDDLNKQLWTQQQLSENLKGIADDDEELDFKREQLKGIRATITKSTKDLGDLRKIASARLSSLTDDFNAVASHLLNQSVDGSVRFTSEQVIPDLNYEGDMSSAGLVTLRLLIFDLACMRGSVRDGSHHPGFLIHDSPREADLSAWIYRRIFTLIAGETESKDIQYIIATTEAPPKELQEHPWMVCEPLSSAQPELRFLRTTLPTQQE